jgi:hypothetical protein
LTENKFDEEIINYVTISELDGKISELNYIKSSVLDNYV